MIKKALLSGLMFIAGAITSLVVALGFGAYLDDKFSSEEATRMQLDTEIQAANVSFIKNYCDETKSSDAIKSGLKLAQLYLSDIENHQYASYTDKGYFLTLARLTSIYQQRGNDQMGDRIANYAVSLGESLNPNKIFDSKWKLIEILEHYDINYCGEYRDLLLEEEAFLKEN